MSENLNELVSQFPGVFEAINLARAACTTQEEFEALERLLSNRLAAVGGDIGSLLALDDDDDDDFDDDSFDDDTFPDEDD